jgi:diguanylate cyclase (GGDEF)-like protein/putative nucleotidyltransferase with HDIG domain
VSPETGAVRLSAFRVHVRAYFTAIIVLGFAWLAYRTAFMSPPEPLVCIVLALLAAAAAHFRIDLPRPRGATTISLACAVDFGALLLFGPDVAILIAAASALAQCTLRPEPRPATFLILFSMASLVLTVQAAGLVQVALAGHAVRQVVPLLGSEASIAGAAATYFLVNVLLVSIGSALVAGRPVRGVVDEELGWSALHYFVGFAVATVGAFLVHGADYVLALLMVGPLYFLYRTYRSQLDRIDTADARSERVYELHLSTIEALARAIEAKDRSTTCHIRRVHVYAAGLARAAGLSEAEVQGVRTAALLHDIGKLAVPDHILAKPGALTPEEFQKVRIHPLVGAEIMSRVPFPYPVAPFILSHHERWDGSGYPHGLRADEIPIGARILAVVDYFDALRSDRPYQQAVTLDEAIERTRADAGKALDPALVDLFIERLPEFQAELDRIGGVLAPLPSYAAERSATDAASPAAPVAEPRGSTSAYQDITLAHREVYALYEIAQAMGTSLGIADTMTLIASKLTNLIPFSTCALFLYEEAEDSLACRFVSGVDAALVQQLTLPNGQGVVGWVGRNLRPLVNARPKADFDVAGIAHETTLQSALVCPLVFGGRLIGALALYHISPAAFSDDHRRLLDRVTEQASGVVHNSVVYEQTKRDSLTDPLTGLPNTRFMFVHLSRELSRAQRLGSEVSLLVMDLDGFKEINDRYGHHIGDRALREVARVLRTEIRPYDICVRYAGDEFVIVLSDCGPEEAESKRRELQHALANVAFEIRPDELLPLRCSCGSASFPRDGETYEVLMSTADKRMYEDKAIRKRVVAEPEPAAEPRPKRPSVFAKIPTETSDRPH